MIRLVLKSSGHYKGRSPHVLNSLFCMRVSVFLLSHHTVIQLRSSHVITGTTLFRHASYQNHELKPHYFEIYFHFIIMFVLPACGSAHHMPGAYRSQKEALDPLEPELQKVVSHHIGAGNRTLVH